MWTMSFASGFSSHSGGPDGSFKNATMDWIEKKDKKIQNDESVSLQKATLDDPVNNRVTGDDLREHCHFWSHTYI